MPVGRTPVSPHSCACSWRGFINMRAFVWDLSGRYALALPVSVRMRRLRLVLLLTCLLPLGLRLVVVVGAPGDPNVKARWC